MHEWAPARPDQDPDLVITRDPATEFQDFFGHGNPTRLAADTRVIAPYGTLSATDILGLEGTLDGLGVPLTCSPVSCRFEISGSPLGDICATLSCEAGQFQPPVFAETGGEAHVVLQTRYPELIAWLHGEFRISAVIPGGLVTGQIYDISHLDGVLARSQHSSSYPGHTSLGGALIDYAAARQTSLPIFDAIEARLSPDDLDEIGRAMHGRDS